MYSLKKNLLNLEKNIMSWRLMLYLGVSTTRCSVKGKWSPFDIIAITFRDEEIVAADYMAYAARQGLHKTELA